MNRISIHAVFAIALANLASLRASAFGTVGAALGVAPVFLANALLLGGGSYLSRPGANSGGSELR